ncbi:MAG TPA: GNAT family N-acetyltransferase [Bryobacteraceae bacterium]|nr:GNAT family N-acetyltransferase [Bryobacteraceae bacterium]
MPEPEIQAVADNLVEALRFFGRARQDAEIRDLAGVTLIFCGLNYAAFNAALLTRPIENDAELTRLIQISSAQFESKRLRWTYWLCDDFLSRPLSRQAPHIFSRHGLRQLTKAPGMYAERLRAPQRQLPLLEVRAVSDQATRATFAEIMSVAFDIPHSVSSAVYGSERGWSGGFQGYIGYANGKAVTTAASMITGDVIGLYSVATLPQHRRLGFAEAIMRAVIEPARVHAGAQRTVLQSTPSGLSLYEQMGYRTVTNFDVYIAD